jgi:hypothetical protein
MSHSIDRGDLAYLLVVCPFEVKSHCILHHELVGYPLDDDTVIFADGRVLIPSTFGFTSILVYLVDMLAIEPLERALDLIPLSLT